MEFSWFDIVLGILILFLAMRGLISGFIREFLGFVGIVGGVYIASVYCTNIGALISAHVYAFKNPSAVSLVGFLVILVGVWVCAFLLGEVLQKFTKLSPIGFLNRILGFLFGALKVFVIIAIITAALAKIQFIKGFIENKTQNSYLYPMLKSTGDAIIQLDLT